MALCTKCLKGFKIIEECLLEPVGVYRGKEDPDKILSIPVNKVKIIFLVDSCVDGPAIHLQADFKMIKDYRLTELVLFVCFFNVNLACPMHLAKVSYCFYD